MNVELPGTLYVLTPNQVLVPTVRHILTSIQNDATLNHFGPYAVADANTELVRVRKIIPLPFKYVSLFLSQAITPRMHFEIIYPLLVTDQLDVQCRVLTRFFQMAMTRQAANQPLALEVPLPPACPRNDIILQARDQVIEHHFPQISQNLTTVQQNQIATQLANLHQAQLTHRREDEQCRLVESKTTIEKWLDRERFDILLRISRVQCEQDLAPIWGRLANLKKAEWGSTVQATYDNIRDRLNETHLTMIADNVSITTTISLTWSMTTRDSIEIGIIPFRFGDTDVEAVQRLQAQIELMYSGNANPSLADAQKALEFKIVLPTADSSNRNIRRIQIWCLTFLPEHHPIQQFLHNHYNDMESFRPEWNIWVPYRPEYAPAKGIMHLKKDIYRNIRVLESTG